VRRFAITAALVSAAAVVAAPAPPPSEKELIAKHWGKTGGLGEFKLNDNRLVIRSTSGEPVQDFAWGRPATMPHVSRVVRGDFEMTVRVADVQPPGKDTPNNSGGMSATSAGLFLVGGEGGQCSTILHLYQYYQKVNGALLRPELTRYVYANAWYPRGGAGSSLKVPEAGKSTYLRMARRDNKITYSYSFDGKEWSKPINPFQGQQINYPDEVARLTSASRP
jgi:hypothetical protein